MKINHSTPKDVSLYETKHTEKGQKAKRSERPPSPQGEAIALISAEAKLLQQVRQIVDAMDNPRPEMQDVMEEVRKKLEDGTYLDEVSGEEIVAKIITDLQEGTPV